MSDGVSFDFSELNTLTADLVAAPVKVLPKIRQALEVSARHIKDDWRADWSGSSTVPGGAAAISYDIEGASSAVLGKSAMSAEIGPELKGQGAVVGMLEYGTPNTGPRGFGAAALKKNEPDFEKGIGLATEGLI
ncbi:hypothetical protein J2X63_003179 [Agromyces sp. 3263]|uniref:hypothetical protein n=1 Tax=Agromyces sp. 3263 TaxID=2817750 RepID=UPI00286686E1|nr:hypothetical protein [Agromyces sp. 3263]MDR6907471.1 hypothetical protein [Agromyces sp. 3263]